MYIAKHNYECFGLGHTFYLAYTVYFKKSYMFCDCNYKFATILTPLLQIYICSNYSA